MTDNLKKFLELVSAEDKAYAEKVCKADVDELIALAAEKGVTLTAADFEQPGDAEGEVSVDEADAVAGGGKCYCFLSGDGRSGKTYDSEDNYCGCVVVGDGTGWHGREGFRTRCDCPVYGSGVSYV